MIFAYPPAVSSHELDLLCTLIEQKKPTLIGISLSSSYFPIADQITKRIKEQFSIPVLWGGAGPTTNPEKMIKHCDILAIGEAEYSVVELVKRVEAKKHFTDISNLWINKDGNTLRNPTNPLIQDLNALPFPDFSYSNKYLIDKDEIIENCKETNNFPGTYTIMTSRGCPFSCSFCINDYYRKLYKGEKYVRRRSVQNIIDELLLAKKTLSINYITFYDEVFTFDKQWIKEFCAAYKQQLGLPFWCNIYPTLIDEEMISWLKDAGVESVTLGIQSGSEKLVREIYTRNAPNEKILFAAQLLHKYKIKYIVDVITESPFETEEDCKKTLDLLLALPRPFSISTISKLSLFENLLVTTFAQSAQKKLDKKTFEFYNYLYLLASFSYMPKKTIIYLSRQHFFKKRPQRLCGFISVHNSATYTKDMVKNLLSQKIWLKVKKSVYT
ncbi:MAG: radical SAM protein [Nanoarchaeota archaeon]